MAGLHTTSLYKQHWSLLSLSVCCCRSAFHLFFLAGPLLSRHVQTDTPSCFLLHGHHPFRSLRRNPVKVTIGSQDLSASHSVTQVCCPALPCPALPCPAPPRPALPCPAPPCCLPMCTVCYHVASVTVCIVTLFHLYHLLQTYLYVSVCVLLHETTSWKLPSA